MAMESSATSRQSEQVTWHQTAFIPQAARVDRRMGELRVSRGLERATTVTAYWWGWPLSSGVRETARSCPAREKHGVEQIEASASRGLTMMDRGFLASCPLHGARFRRVGPTHASDRGTEAMHLEKSGSIRSKEWRSHVIKSAPLTGESGSQLRRTDSLLFHLAGIEFDHDEAVPER
jgi:hypothetical protein